MTRTVESLDEYRARHLLEALAEAVPPLPEEELAALARSAAAAERGPARRSILRPWSRAVLAAAVAMTLAAGVGIGRWLAPAEATQALVLPAVEPGFLPAGGWFVVDDGIAVPPGMRAAIAANVPLPADGRALDLAPDTLLERLPAGGIVVVASARAGTAGGRRTPPARDRLLLTGAEVQTRWVGPEGGERAVAEYALDSERDGLDLSVRVYLGTAEPSRQQLSAAQAQLDRLVVRTAAAQVTLTARPTLVRWAEQITVSGSISSDRSGERVSIEIRECGTSYWRLIDLATTTSGGNWFSETSVGINGALRARWGTSTSGPVAVTTRPGVGLNVQGNRVRISVGATRSFWGKQVVLQRFDAQRRRWVNVRQARITETGGSGNFIWNQARMTVPIRRGVNYRGVIMNAQSGPCYLAGFSPLYRR